MLALEDHILGPNCDQNWVFISRSFVPIHLKKGDCHTGGRHPWDRVQCAGIKTIVDQLSRNKISGAASGQERGGEVNHLIFQARTSYLPSEIVWGQRLCYHIGRQKLFKSPPFSGLNIRQWCMIRRRPSMQSPTQPSTPLFQTTLQGALLSVKYVTKSR